MFVSAIIVAGGRGTRMGAAVPKQLLRVGGRSMLERSVDAFRRHHAVAEVVVVLPSEMVADPPAGLLSPGAMIHLVAGGARRQDSVANGFAATSASADVVLVHDAARPFVSAALIDRTIAAAAESGAAIAALPVRDTVKQAGAEGGPALWIDATLPRETIHLAQTPQAFRRGVLQEAIAVGQRGVEGTDEAALAERAGHRVRLVEGEARNMKITTAEDLEFARALAATSDGPGVRVGHGYDLHRLVAGRPLLLGGVSVPFEKGLAGHSDADVLAHAITDAILGAAGAGDIGRHFPDTDPRWKGACSLDLLARAVAMVAGRGYRVVNVDAVVVAERPKLAPHAPAIVESLSRAIGIDGGSVSVKAKTNEGLGETGHGEAMAAYAVALIART